MPHIIAEFNEWKRVFLKIKGLKGPDGRRLFKYRIEEREFSSLREFLTGTVEEYLPEHDLAWLCARPGFSDLFVLFCAEWWRRSYAGDGFKWAPMLSEIAINEDAWTQQQRSKCVERGLNGWGRNISKSGGHTYIGSVAAEGGLPMKLLANARGGIGTLVSRVLHDAKSASVSENDLAELVKGRSGRLLPKSFQQDAIIQLIASLAHTILDLKERAGLTAQSDSILCLDQKIPRWREELPLLMEDQHANSLIEQLVKEAARIRLERQQRVFVASRSLEQIEPGRFWLRSAIDVPESISLEALGKLFEIPLDELPRSADIRISSGNTSIESLIRRRIGGSEYVIARTPWEILGVDAAGEHILHLISKDGRKWSASIPKGFALDPSLPWIFAGDDNLFGYCRQGDGGVNASMAVAAVPSGWIVEPHTSEASIEFAGSIEELSRHAHQFNGEVVATDVDGNQYRSRTGQPGTDESFEWVGRRVWLELQYPSMAFRGMPSLYAIDGSGTKRKVDGEPLFESSLGPIKARFPANGEIRHRSSLLLLPPTSSEKIEPLDERSGLIHLDGWQANFVNLLTPNVAVETAKGDSGLVIRLGVTDSYPTPESIDFEVFWNQTSKPARIRFPFPSKGVRVYDSKGEEIPSRSSIAVQSLLGTRLTVLGTTGGSRVRLTLVATEKKIYRNYYLDSAEGSSPIQVRLADYRTEIDRLLFIDDHPDSTVSLKVEIDGKPAYRLTILPYRVRSIRGEMQFSIESVDRSDIASKDAVALALPLERPGEEPIVLERKTENVGEEVVWNFSPGEFENGTWLVYPPQDSEVQFRPRLWPIDGEGVVDNPYVEAISIADRIAREAAIDELIVILASDFDHQGWDEIERLANQLGHLPLATLDIWRRFVASSKGMASLAFRFSRIKGDFLARFANELPFTWEIVTYDDWHEATELLGSQIENAFGKENQGLLFESYFRNRVDELTTGRNDGVLFYLFGLLMANYFDGEKREAALVKDILAPNAKSILFDGGGSKLNELRTRRGVDETWPEGLEDLMGEARRNSTISKFMCTQELGFKGQVDLVNLPIILAVQVILGETEDWFCNPHKVSYLAEYKSFDPDWFDDAFNLTITRCLGDGLFDQKL